MPNNTRLSLGNKLLFLTSSPSSRHDGIVDPWSLGLQDSGGSPVSAPKNFSNPCFERISANQLIEEENLLDYLAVRYYPVRMGELFASRYQVVGKLGFGATSTA